MATAKKKVGWWSAYADRFMTDEECIGYGNPPSCPLFQQENPGMGRLPCERKVIPDQPKKS